ncbi:MAG: S8 family serine peptidase [Ginsengibacter sp.]
MKKRWLLLSVFSFFVTSLFAQNTFYIVKLKDKIGTPFSINQPSQFLSLRAIERRQRQRISIDETDLPITPRYIDSIRLSGNVTIVNVSKWLNQVCIFTTDIVALNKINQFPFVQNTLSVKRRIPSSIITKNKFVQKTDSTTSNTIIKGAGDILSYGNSYDQIHIHEGEFLHNKGFQGQGMLLSIIDAGFYHYLILPAFDSVRANQQIVETFDFVKNHPDVNEEDSHGMSCFSIIAANIPDKLIGSGNKAHFLLYRSEDVYSESPLEEQNWIAAAERSDSAGADVITTSLGYNTFDNPQFDYTYQDMNGRTTMIAIAATYAARKGMIVLAAAGNEGNVSWHYIITPADADSILSVGAVNSSGVIGSFSSYGPSADGRVKPTVASVGVGTFLSSSNGTITQGNGTSFATPNLAGLVICLWQAFPEFTNIEIIESVKKSSSIYQSPNNRIGYGIPNFRIAYEDLAHQRYLRALKILGNQTMKVYPNPAKDNFTVMIKSQNSGPATLQFFDVSGKLYLTKSVVLQKDEIQTFQFNNFPPLAKGVYFLKLNDGNSQQSLKIMIQ